MKYQDFHLPELVDDTLTPENAPSRGYEHEWDVIYQTDAPYIAMKDVIDLVENDGYKLGCPASNPDSDFCGIYKPIK